MSCSREVGGLCWLLPHSTGCHTRAGLKNYQWKEPAADTEVLETVDQTVHMDVQDGKGGSLVVSVDAL